MIVGLDVTTAYGISVQNLQIIPSVVNSGECRLQLYKACFRIRVLQIDISIDKFLAK